MGRSRRFEWRSPSLYEVLGMITVHDDGTRTVTTYDESGGVVGTRPYTAMVEDPTHDGLYTIGPLA